MTEHSPLNHSPLSAFHISARAKMADFGGWEMPIEYPLDAGGGVVAEHQAVRERLGLFDVSHLGKISVTGEGAESFLNRSLTNDLSRITDGQAQYTMICDDANGGVIDDLIVYRRSKNEFLLIPNAANTVDVHRRLRDFAPTKIEIVNRHKEFGVIAVQGPKTPALLESLGIELELDYMSFTNIEIAGRGVIICRTGYTGEFGYEILPRWSEVEEVWDALHRAALPLGGLVCGLGSRDTLRTEMGYPLHGHELSREITPLQAGASWAVGWNKAEFWGRNTLVQERAVGPKRQLRGLLLQDRGIPRSGMQVTNNGVHIGEITSGTFSPSLKIGIALALLSTQIDLDTLVEVDIRGKLVSAKVVKPPFLPSRVR